MVKYISVFLVSAVALSSCFGFGGERVRGNGEINTEERALSDFDGVESYGSFDVYLTTGNNYSVKVEADDNLLHYIETDISGNKLRIRTARGYNLRPSSTMKVYVSAPKYSVVSSSGSGNVYGQAEIVSDDDLDVNISGSGNIDLDVKAAKVSADISGSGSITLDGEADAISSSIAGSGDIKAANLKTRDASVHIAGSGNADLQAEEKLDVEIAGSGDVRYAGDAKVNSHIAGSGSVRKID